MMMMTMRRRRRRRINLINIMSFTFDA